MEKGILCCNYSKREFKKGGGRKKKKMAVF